MDGPGRHYSGSSGAPPGKKAKSLALQKCDFCRDRKVKCEPQNRQWPDTCNHCQRRGEKCSPPSFAMRRPRLRHENGTARGQTTSSSRQSPTEASTTPREEAPLSSGGIDAMNLGTAEGVELTLQHVKDITTVLRCYHVEHSVEISQSKWLESYFRNNENIEIKKQDYLGHFAERLRAISRIRRLTSQHVKSLLQTRKHSSMERALICQLLVDLESSFSTFTSSSCAFYHQEDLEFTSDLWQLAVSLHKNGDYNGSLTLLHRIPLAQIGGTELRMMLQIVVDLCARLRIIPDILGIGDDLRVLNVFEHMEPLVLPYSILAAHSNQPGHNEMFITKSFMWPWIRNTVLEDARDQLDGPVNWKPTSLDPGFRDAFGHAFLHSAFFSQDYEHLKAIIEEVLLEGIGGFISTDSPSYAPGLTPLACSASSLGNWVMFRLVFLFSDKNICCGTENGAPTHTFCALAIAVRKKKYAEVEALIDRSTEQNIDISNCCWWTISWLPAVEIPPNIWTLLEQTQRQPIADS